MENYFEDLLGQLIDEALNVKKNASNEFERGKLVGFYQAISKILNLAEAFDVSHKLPIQWRSFNPEELLND